ncbi:uncharacterized protein [Amphiura filiformis]|uniref:uncharacterized protein n=1 Tax=Amphiura filiformis TaxID=82378 RepID=UPI003B20F197
MMATLRVLVLLIAVFGAVMITPSLADYEDLETGFIFKWHGGFIGEIEIPIEDDIDGWNMTITFPKRVFEFEICPAEVVDIEDKRVVHLRNKPWNAKLDKDTELEMWFNAKTWRKIRGLVGIVHFEGNVVSTNNTNVTESSSSESDFSSSAGGYNNNLTCDGFNNITCGASFELMSGSGAGPFVAQIELDVDFADVDTTSVEMTTNVPFLYIQRESSFDPILVTENGDEIGFTGVLTSKNQKEHSLIIAMKSDLEEAGHGRLTIQFRFGVTSTAFSPVIFPHITETSECFCTRLFIL